MEGADSATIRNGMCLGASGPHRTGCDATEGGSALINIQPLGICFLVLQKLET